LTLGALLRLEEADVVIYDRLVSKEVLDLVPPRVAKVFGGKLPGSDGNEEQAKINERMLSEARSGKKVVRLKGGDPFLFSRGGEEAEFLRDHGVEFDVVPGVSSALAVPAYAGIPLTHRGYSSSVTVVTGREANSKRKLDWSGIAGGSDVVVVLMGAAQVEGIAKKLLKAGKAPDTPVAAIMRGTTMKQKTVLMTLGEAAIRGGHPEIEAPSVIVVGKVVALSRKLRWLRESA
jgi:uroporphyrin-III C-methyltransferase